jgi:hypothetical protein
MHAFIKVATVNKHFHLKQNKYAMLNMKSMIRGMASKHYGSEVHLYLYPLNDYANISSKGLIVNKLCPAAIKWILNHLTMP